MAGIDYNIANQIKGIQLEPPENAMMRAMQLRGLQETSQMNALKAQEYQQQVQERNALNRLMANKKIPYGSDAFYSALATEAPSFYEKIATGDVQRQQALAAKTEREEKTRKFQEDQRRLAREFGLRKIAGAKDYRSAVSLIDRSVRTGELDQEEANDMLYELHAAGPDTNMDEFRSSLITRLLPADKALTAPYDIEKAGLGVSAEKQKLEADKFKFQAEQVDNRLKEFNAAFPALAITSEKDVEARIRAMADDKVLGPLSQRFGSLDATIARNVAEYKRDPINYIKRLSGVSAADILKAAEEKDKQEYSQYRFNEILSRRTPLTQEAYFKKKRGGVAAPVAAAADGAAPVAAADGATPVAAAENTTASAAPPLAAADAAAAAQAEKAPPVGTPVVKEATTYGVELLDPDAQAMYAAAAAEENPVVKEVYLKLAEKILAESAARKRNKEYTGTFQNVDVALRELELLKKQPETEENKKRIAVLEQLVATAQVGPPQALPRPPAPTDISKKENELEDLQSKLAAETDPNKKKTLKDRIARLKADIRGDVYGREKTPATTAVQDALISKAILDGRLDPGKVNSRNIATIAKTLEMDPNANLKELSIDAMSGAAASRALAIQSAKILTAANEAKSMMKIVKTVSDKIDRTQYPTINAIQNAVDKGTGGKEIVQLNAAINALVNAYARAINPTGVSTVSDKTHAREVINSNYANGQLDAILDIMNQEMVLAQKSPGEASAQLKEQRNASRLAAPKAYTDAEKERRYQEWKAKQGGK